MCPFLSMVNLLLRKWALALSINFFLSPEMAITRVDCLFIRPCHRHQDSRTSTFDRRPISFSFRASSRARFRNYTMPISKMFTILPRTGRRAAVQKNEGALSFPSRHSGTHRKEEIAAVIRVGMTDERRHFEPTNHIFSHSIGHWRAILCALANAKPFHMAT